MKKLINQLKHNTLFGIIVGGVLFGSIGIYGVNKYQSNTIEYSPTDSNWKVNNVSEAINSLYSIKKEIEIPYYTLLSTVTSAGTDTYSTYSIIEFTYTNIEGYNKVQKFNIDTTAGGSGGNTSLICYTARGEKVVIAGANDVGIYDISNCRTLKLSYIYYQRDKYNINLPLLLNEDNSYKLTSAITSVGTDTYSTYSIIEFTYLNIEGYNKVQKLKTDTGGGYSGERTALTCIKSSGQEVTIAGANDAGTYDISGCTTLKMSYLYYQKDKYDINLPNLLP